MTGLCTVAPATKKTWWKSARMNRQRLNDESTLLQTWRRRSTTNRRRLPTAAKKSTTTGILQLDSLELSMAGMQYTIAVTSTKFIGASSMLTSVTIFSRSRCQFPWYHSAAYRYVLLIKRDDQVQGCLLIMCRFWGSWTVLWMEPGSSSWKNWQRSASGILGQRHPLSLHSWWNLADRFVHFQHQGDTCLSATVDSSVSGWALQNQSLHGGNFDGCIHGGPTKY